MCGNLKKINLLGECGVARETGCYRNKDSGMYRQPIHYHSVEPSGARLWEEQREAGPGRNDPADQTRCQREAQEGGLLSYPIRILIIPVVMPPGHTARGQVRVTGVGVGESQPRPFTPELQEWEDSDGGFRGKDSGHLLGMGVIRKLV